jgi:hypothetical protein
MNFPPRKLEVTMLKKSEIRPAHCTSCQYPLYAYALCCPMCGASVEAASAPTDKGKRNLTRFDFWLAGLRRNLGITRLRRAAAESSV